MRRNPITLKVDISNRNKLMVWFNSHCSTHSRRLWCCRQ
jgi:alpha-1,3-fucosyltransferase